MQQTIRMMFNDAEFMEQW